MSAPSTVIIASPVWAPGEADAVLTIDGRPTAVPLWSARTGGERRTGLLGTDAIAGALWIERCNSVHCVGMRHTIDVVHVARTGRVLSVRRMAPGSIGLPRLRARAVVELGEGEAEALEIRPGSVLGRSPRV